MGEPSRQIEARTPQQLVPITNTLQNLAGKRTYTPTRYDQPIFSPMTGGETSALNRLRSMTYGTQPLFAGGTQLISDTMRGKYLDPSSNPNLKKSADLISDKAKMTFEDALDEISGGSNKSGNLFSTSTKALKTGAAGAFSEGLSNALAGLYGGAYNNERSNQLSALSSGLNYTNLPFQQTSNLLTQEALPREIQNQMLGSNYQDFLRYNGEMRTDQNAQFNDLMALLQGYPIGYPQYSQGRSAFQDASSILGPLALLASSFA